VLLDEETKNNFVELDFEDFCEKWKSGKVEKLKKKKEKKMKEPLELVSFQEGAIHWPIHLKGKDRRWELIQSCR